MNNRRSAIETVRQAAADVLPGRAVPNPATLAVGRRRRPLLSAARFVFEAKAFKVLVPGILVPGILVPRAFVLGFFALTASSPARASSDAAQRDFQAVGQPVAPAPADPAIASAIGSISAARIRQTIEKLVSFRNRSTLSSMETDLKPGTGVSAAADWIEAELKRYSAACRGCLEVKRDTFTEPADAGPDSRIRKPTVISNVYAVLRGTDPAPSNRMYLVTAHYDSRNSSNENTHDAAPGANDDASGIAVSLECARVLSALKLRGTLVFVAVAGEEQGLNGSLHLARLARSEGWPLDAVLNNDIVGGNTTPGDSGQNNNLIRVFSEGVPASATAQQLRMIENLGAESDSPSRELARALLDTARTYLPARTLTPILEFRRDRFLRGGDHTSFNEEGFAAVRLTEWREDFNHQHQDVRVEGGLQFGDLLQYVDFDYVSNVARLNAAALGTLAAAPASPRNVKLVAKDLTNESELRWDAAPGAAEDGKYEVVWRETAAPDWQYSTQSAKNAIKLPISKDNVIFGVRAVDAAGHRSLVATPAPER